MGEEGGLWSVCELFVGASWVGQASGSFCTFFKAFTNKHTHTHTYTHTHTPTHFCHFSDGVGVDDGGIDVGG